MERPPLLFLYPSLRRSTTHDYLVRHHFAFPPLRPLPHHRLPIRHTTTTRTPPSPSPPYLTRLRRLARSIPTLTLLTLSYLLYSLNYALLPVTGASMSPLLNPSLLSQSASLSSFWRKDWVWVENWPSRLIRFADPALNPPSSDNEAGALTTGIPWRKLSIPTSRNTAHTTSPRGLIRRGLVVVLYAPSFPRGEEGKLLVKRIVALPGDVVTPRAGAKYPRQRVVVPEGSVWVEGDNEDGERSWDSNFFGPVGVAMVVGTVGGRVWPLGRRGRLEEGGQWLGSERVVEGGGTRVRKWSGGGDELGVMDEVDA